MHVGFFKTAEFSLVAVGVLLFVLAIMVMVIIVSVIFKLPIAKRVGVVGLLLCMLFITVPLYNLYQRDWTIPECRDENGELKRENPKCQF